MNRPKLREVYRPSGRVDPVRFPIAVGLAFILASAMAYGVERLLLQRDMPLLAVFVSLILTLPLAATVFCAGVIGRCRNPCLALGVGIVAGLWVLFGPFWFAALRADGPGMAFQLELLPGAIRASLGERLDQLLSSYTGPRVVSFLSSSVTWLATAVAIGLASWAPGLTGWSVGSRVYAEPSQRETSAALLLVPAPVVEAIRLTLPTQSLMTLSAQIADRPAYPQIGDYLLIYYVPGFVTDDHGDSAFLSVSNAPPSNAVRLLADDPWHPPSAVDLSTAPKTKHFSVPRRLELEEVELIAAQCPPLRELFGFPATKQWPYPPFVTDGRVEISARPSGEVAAATPPTGTVLKAVTGGLYAECRTLLYIGGMGWLLVVIALGFLAEAKRPDWFSAFYVSVGLFLPPILWLTFVQRSIFRRVLRALVRRELGDRPERCVDARDRQSHFVRVIPRAVWDKTLRQNAEIVRLASTSFSDVGFLKVDTRNGQLLYEGDHERWRLPFDSITFTNIEPVAAYTEFNRWEWFYLVILRARLKDGTVWEATLEAILVRLQCDTNRWRQRAAEELQREIAEAVSTSAPQR